VPKGIYEYVIARTRYIDAVFMDVLEQGFDQIVIFGAGFDSLAQRFSQLHKKTKIFEPDAPITQEEKVIALKEKNIMIPENLTYIPVNFIQESLAEKPTEAKFEKGRKSLFLLEGVTMYLPDGVIDKFSMS
jgi:methyltransferase (TIGR00027 family)